MTTVVFICLVAFLLIHSLGSPAVGTVKTAQSQITTPKPANPKHTQGKYIGFSYPGAYSAQSSAAPSGTELEVFNFVDRSTYPNPNISISVLTLPSGKLSDDGSYNYRLVNSDKYSSEIWQINASPVTIMDDKTGGYSKAAFLVHGQLVAEVALSSGNSANSASLDNDLRAVLDSFKWLMSG